MTIPLVATESVDRPTFIDRLLPVLPAAQRLAFGMLQNGHEAEDAVQESVLKAWRAIDRLREGSELRPWFLTIVANECRQRRRSRWWSVSKMSELPVAVTSEAGESAADLRAALRRLPAEMRMVLVLRYYLDMRFQEMADVLHCSAQAAKSRTFRALQRLRVETPEELGE
ncbi:MAG TPA: RNA polymerase sigma factor [Candidatus Dormibacteraeota bacterium]|nr:RNA polymerase sigma factor [Candidatus Dormibacteraeota bacterium]